MSYSWDNDASVSVGVSGGGVDYASARQAYNSGPSRSVPASNSQPSPSARSSSSRSTKSFASSGVSPVNQRISTDAKNVVMLRIDTTGSNKENAYTAFEKLPLLFDELGRYLENPAVSLGFVGDARSDNAPIQVRDFNAGKALDAELLAMYPEGYGGGQGTETYELNAYYDVHCVDIPNAVNPFYFLLCDEGFNPHVQATHIKRHLGIDIEGDKIDSLAVFQSLMQKYNVYILRCEYGGYNKPEAEIDAEWKRVFGERVLMLDDPGRVVDVILGVISAETGQFNDFSKRLGSRQTKGQVSSVMSSVRSVSARSKDASGNSVTSSKKSGLSSRKLV